MSRRGLQEVSRQLLPPLPRGRRDFARQIAIWAGFALAYELVRALGGARAG